MSRLASRLHGGYIEAKHRGVEAGAQPQRADRHGGPRKARAYAAWSRAHKQYGSCWTQGCEADGIDNPERVLCGMRSERGALWGTCDGARIVEGFTVHSLQPRSGDTSNRLIQT